MILLRAAMLFVSIIATFIATIIFLLFLMYIFWNVNLGFFEPHKPGFCYGRNGFLRNWEFLDEAILYNAGTLDPNRVMGQSTDLPLRFLAENKNCCKLYCADEHKKAEIKSLDKKNSCDEVHTHIYSRGLEIYTAFDACGSKLEAWSIRE
ncbi:hypothetical protein [Rhodomicrobium vannielii]|jgi:hypothetical protein|uniref:hypothetical protein n=1 Tax=Rhodomicrobium vannielii TaxID=1069 RepID=UPI00059FE921|nr:hypothetical protein [Rhodomicrobium vannielii]